MLSRDETVQREYDEDPLRVDGSTARLGREIIRAMKQTSALLGRISIPLYVLHGENDMLVPPSASAAIGRVPNATRKLWPGLRHECLNEPEQDQVIADLVGWLDTQLEVINPTS